LAAGAGDTRVLVEACIDSIASAEAAERGGARRLELCGALYDGGITPSAGMIGLVRERVAVPLFVIVRPRGGGFVYTEDEILVILRDIAIARELGVDGIVVGALARRGGVDVTRICAMVHAAAPLPVTFHRAVDLVADQRRALDDLAHAGVQRVLTSGGAMTAIAGADRIRELVTHAAGRLTVMAGGAIREAHVSELIRRSGVTEIHVRGTRLTTTSPGAPTIVLRKPLPSDESAWEETDEARIRDVVRLANA
jgi:copper homeostasis protein